MNEDVAERVNKMCDEILKSWEEPTIEVKYHDGASKLGEDVHGVMCDMAASEMVELMQGDYAVKAFA